MLTDEALRLQVPEQPALGVNPDGVCFVIDRARSVAERHLWQAQNAMPRGWQWWTDFTRLDFTAKAGGTPDTIRHHTFGFDPQGNEPTMRLFIVAEVPLDVTERPPPPEPMP